MTEPDTSTQQPMRPALRRSSSDRMIGGVCGGLARTLGVDPIIVRVIVAILALLGGTGVAAYIIAWILIPDDSGSNALRQSRDGRGRFPQFLLVIVLAAAGLSLLHVGWPGTSGDAVGILVFILIAVVGWQAFGSGHVSTTQFTGNPGGWGSGHFFSHAAPGQTVTVEKGPDGQTVTVQSGGATTVVHKAAKSVLGRIVWNVLAVAVGLMLLTNYTGATDLSGRSILAIALAIVGLGLAVSAFAGRARGLIALGLLLGLLMLPAGIDTSAGTGTRTWAPLTVAAASAQQYDLAAGDATLDLRSLSPTMGETQTVSIKAHVGAGTLVVLLPTASGVHGSITANVGVGELMLPTLPNESGVNQSLTTSYGADAAVPGPTINLDLAAGVGQIEVRYA